MKKDIIKNEIKNLLSEILNEECTCALPGSDRRPPDFYPPTEETSYYYGLLKNKSGLQDVVFTMNMKDIIADHDGETTSLLRIKIKNFQSNEKLNPKELQVWSDKEGLWIPISEASLF